MVSEAVRSESWDIGSGLGETAVLVAAARAAESAREDRLINDPYAVILVRNSGTAMAKQFADDPADEVAEKTNLGEGLQFLIDYQAVRTHFFDTYFADNTHSGIEQVVILASGLDSRPYRLDWPETVTLFEIDRSEVLAYKSEVLARNGASLRVRHQEVPADLRGDWTSALAARGFEATKPTIWLAEGLLTYLSASEETKLLDSIDGISAKGSVIALETAAATSRNSRNEADKLLDEAATELGTDHLVQLNDLVTDEPSRTDPEVWLSNQGWSVRTVDALDELRRLGRQVVDAPFLSGIPHFVVAEFTGSG